MNPSSDERDPVEQLAEEFLARKRRGEKPTLDEYAAGYPQLAAQIRDLFPALLMMEDLGDGSVGATGPHAPAVAALAAPELKQLGDYRILREVGRGGMGVVYEAEQMSLGRHVALKVLPGHALLDPKHLHRFQREAKAAARLHHTNIVPVFGVGEGDGLHYYVMQFIQGQSLDQVLAELKRLRQGRPGAAPATVDGNAAGKTGDLSAADVARSLLTGHFQASEPDGKEHGPVLVGQVSNLPSGERQVGNLPHQGAGASPSSSSVHLPGQPETSSLSESGRAYWQSVARIGIQVAEALAYAASQGITHRDIKPSNLLLDEQGTVWVTDFGLAKVETDGENLTHTGDIVGTLRYLAPERFQGQADARADLYGLGLTLYELLTLRPAFDGADRNKLIQQVMHEEPPRPRKLNPAVPRDLETIILKATARDPAHRYPTAQELAEDLQRFVEDRPIRARRAGLRERLWRWCRRNPVVAGMTSAVAALLVVIAVGSSLSALWLRHERDTVMAHRGELERTNQQLQKAEKEEKQAKEDALEKLWGSYLNQARAGRWSGRAGRRFDSLEALRQAALIRPSVELRDEAIACLALVDLRVERQWKLEPTGAIAFDRTIERYALGDDRGDIRFYRLSDRQELFRLAGPAMPVRILHFSPDGRFLAVKYHKEEIQFYVWDLNRRAALVKLANGVHRNALDFSPDSKWVAAGQIDGTIRRFDLGSGEEAKPLALGVPGHTLRFHPGGRKLAISGERSRSVLIADLDSGKVVRTLAGHAGGLHGLAWHPDGRLLAVGCDDYHVHLWDADRGTKRAVLKGHQAEAVHVTFNNHGDLLASQSWDGTTRLWDPWTGQALVSCTGWGLRFAPGDDRLAFSLGNHGAGTWEVATGRECRVLRGHPGQEKMPWEAAFSTDGQLLASVGGDGVRFWDGVLGKEIAHLRMAGVTSALFHPDGKSLLLSGTFGLQRRPIERDPAAGECIRIGEPQSIWKGSLGRASISTDGRILAALQAPAQLIVLDLEKQVQLALWERHPSANTLAISPDGRWVACGMWRGSGVKVWEARTGKLVRDLPVTGHHSRVDFSPDGRWLVTITYQDYGLWRVGTWEPGPVQELAAVRDLAGSAAFSRDGKVLAVSYEPGRVQMIDPVTGQKLALLEAPTGANLIWLAFSPDGTRLAAASAESHLIQLWDLRQVRKALTALRLDWDLSPIPPLEGEPARPLKVEIVELNGP